MKKIAAIFIFIFSLVQAGPAINALFADNSVVFIVDEDKTEAKTDIEKKDKKEFLSDVLFMNEFSQKINIAFHLAAKIYTGPCIEKLIPPPNFC